MFYGLQVEPNFTQLELTRQYEPLISVQHTLMSTRRIDLTALQRRGAKPEIHQISSIGEAYLIKMPEKLKMSLLERGQFTLLL